MSIDEAAERWWRTLAEHASHGRCREWVHAYTALIETDEYHKGPPPTRDRPHPAAGGARRTA